MNNMKTTTTTTTTEEIVSWATENYEQGGHWIIETGRAADFGTLAEAKKHCAMMDEQEANTRFGDEETPTKNNLEDLDRTGTQWILKRDAKGWKKGQVVTMIGFFDLSENGLFTDGIRTADRPGGKHEHLNFSQVKEQPTNQPTRKNNTMTTTTKKAIQKYGMETCKQAFVMHEEGNGANTIAHSFDVLKGNTRAGDAAINAGREMATTPAPTTKHRTNSTHVRAQIRAHILDRVNDNEGEPFPTIQEAAAHVRAEFERAAGYPANLRRFPNQQDRFLDYLGGLPFSFEFYTQAIAEFLDGLGINPQGAKYKAEKSARLYHCLIFREVMAAQ